MSLRTRTEIRNQGEVLNQLKLDPMIAIDLFAVDFRQIINDYWVNFHIVPTADDIIWLESEKLHTNIRNISG